MEPHRLYIQNIDNILIHIEQTHRLLWSTFLKTISRLHKARKKQKFYEKRECLNHTLKETL